MRHLLDTSAILTHVREENGWEHVASLLSRDDTEVIVASVSLTELARRIRDLGVPEDKVHATIESYRSLLDGVIAIDATVATAAVEMAFRTPRRLPLTDAIIAAAAQQSAAVLVHRDEHMRAIPHDLVQQLDLAEDWTG